MGCQSSDGFKRATLAGVVLWLVAGVLRPVHAQLPVGSRVNLNFALPNVNGVAVNLRAAANGRPLLLNFWSST
jgi:hypothetical protein